MTTLEFADARLNLDVVDSEELARLLDGGSGGEVVLRGTMEDMFGSGTLILDGLRRRPRYFDGRFLTGADLTRDQDYVRQRQADIARAGGSGVISGLMVEDVDSVGGTTLRIEAGHGVTPNGDLVMLTSARDVPVMDLPTTRQLDAAMGLSADPRVPLVSQSGLFVLGLRAVEFTANPIAAYPRSITGQRTVEDGDIIEATAITLVPFPDTSGAGTAAEARRAVARQIFGSAPEGVPQNILPIAMMALDRGTVRWIDVAMVRRELGTDSGVQISLGGRRRAQAEAQVLQHRAHLQDVLMETLARGLPPIFPASQHFSLLPPAGQLPAACVMPEAEGFQQYYFPPTVDVDLAFVPADEIAARVDETLTLPPIALEGAADVVDATSVVIVVPVSRPAFQRYSASLPSVTTGGRADPTAGLKRPALDMLDALVLQRRKALEAAARDAESAAAAETAALERKAWHAAFAEAVGALPVREDLPPLLWYVRRRSVAYRTNTEGLPIAVGGDDIVISSLVNENLARLKLEKRLAAVDARATPQATARVMALLASPAIAASDVMTAAVVADLEKVSTPQGGTVPTPTPAPGPTPTPTPRPKPPAGETPPIIVQPEPEIMLRSSLVRGATDLSAARSGLARINLATALGTAPVAREDTDMDLSESEVLDIAADYASPRLGEGLAAVAPIIGKDWPTPKQAIAIGDSGVALALDAGLRKVKRDQLPELADKIKTAASKNDSAALAEIAKGLG